MLPPKIPGGADIRFTGNVRAIQNHGIIEITSENDQISGFLTMIQKFSEVRPPKFDNFRRSDL